MAHKAAVRIAAAAGVVALTGGAWFAGRQVKSPAEEAAKTRPPAASRITAAVEERTLESTVIVRGLVRYGDPRGVVLATSAVKASSGGATPTPIISEPAVKGATLREGDVALGVGGRPVFVLQGKVPAYRDLRPGDVGDDVQQLEAALMRLGFQPGAVDGRYDTSTQHAVDAWYESKGYRSFGPTDAQRTQLRTARSTLGSTDDAVLAAQRSVDQLERAATGDKLLAAEEQQRAAAERAAAAKDDAALSATRADAEVAARQEALDLATRQVQLAQQTLDRAKRDASDTTPVADANDAVESARSALRSARSALDDASAQVPLADAAVKDAQAALDSARKDLDTAKKTSPQNVTPAGIIIVGDNTESVRAQEAAVRQAEAALRQAQANVASAQRAVDSRTAAVADAERSVTKAEGAVVRAGQSVQDRSSAVDESQQRLLTAQNDVARATRDLAAATLSRDNAAKTAQASIRQSGASVQIATAQLSAVRSPSDVRTARAQLANAVAAEERARSELADLEEQIGIVVPANEVLFFPSLPLRVDEVKAQRGDVVSGAVMTVTTARLAVDSSVDANDAKLVRKGAKATIESSEFDVELAGTVTQIASTTGTNGVDPGKVYLEVTPDADSVSTSTGAAVNSADLNGASVKLTIPIQSTGKAVLAVPVAGVSVAPDGSSRVEVEVAPDKPTRFVRVRTGISAEGYVAVVPVGGALAAGDLVVIGNRDGSTIEGSLGENDQPGDGSDTLPPVAATDAVGGAGADTADTTVAPASSS